jgi:hypothetical protein
MFRRILKIFNLFIIKRKNRIYLVPHTNGQKDSYDLINYTADNVLCLVNALLKSSFEVRVTLFLERFDRERDGLIDNYVRSFNNDNVKIVLLDSYNFKKGFSKVATFIKNSIIRYSCKTWIVDTCFVNFFDKLRSQKYINLNYSTPFKSSNGYKKTQFFTNIDFNFETSFLTACIHSAEYRIPLPNCFISGFPRNDNLFSTNKSNAVLNWIRAKTTSSFAKIIVYVPTYRDYPEAYSKKNVLGFEDPNDLLFEFLEKNNYILIAKFHPLQDLSSIKYNDRIIQYESTYDFSLYDLLAMSDLLISDYSSVIHDYLLTGKPIVLDFFDQDKYNDSRGFAFDPIENICPGPICTNLKELLNCISIEINNPTRSEKYNNVTNWLHKYKDNHSTDRAVTLIKSLIR